jgi:hypothetical protein
MPERVAKKAKASNARELKNIPFYLEHLEKRGKFARDTSMVWWVQIPSSALSKIL